MLEVITVYFGFIYKAVVFFPAGLRNSASYQSSNEMRDTSLAIDPISDQCLYMYDRSPPVIDPVGVRSKCMRAQSLNLRISFLLLFKRLKWIKRNSPTTYFYHILSVNFSPFQQYFVVSLHMIF